LSAITSRIPQTSLSGKRRTGDFDTAESWRCGDATSEVSQTPRAL
jgi:hypothetical protein